MSVPYGGALSGSSCAILQRNRAAMRSAEERTIEKAKAADRAAKYTLKKQLKSKGKDDRMDTELEKLEESRFWHHESGLLSQSLITFLC